MGKRYNSLKKSNKEIALKDALEIVKNNSTVKFDETVEININLNVLKKHSIRDTVIYKNPFGETKKVLVFAQNEKVKEAEEAGADFVGSDDLIEKIQNGWLDFDVAIATTSMMRHVAKVARVLASKGLMPNPKAKTVSDDIKSAVMAVKAGRREFRANDKGVVNFPVGKVSMDSSQIEENIRDFYDIVLKKKPNDLKGDYIKSVFISSTMGVGIGLDKKNF